MINIFTFSVVSSLVIVESENKQDEKEQNSWKDYFCFTYGQSYLLPQKHKNIDQTKAIRLIGSCFGNHYKHYDKLNNQYRKRVVYSLYAGGTHKKDNFLLLILKFFFLDKRYLLHHYRMVMKNFNSKNQYGQFIKIIIDHFFDQSILQKLLIKEYFLPWKRNINSTYRYADVLDGCRLEETTILTFLLLKMKQEIKKNNMAYLTQLSLLFKFLVVVCDAHLFARDAHNNLPIMMIEKDNALKQIIENSFGVSLFQNCIKNQLKQPFCTCTEYQDHVDFCTNSVFDAIANYDKECLKLILRYTIIDFSSFYFHNYQDISTFKRPIKYSLRFSYQQKITETVLSFAILFQKKFLLFHKKAISPNIETESPYLPIIQILIDECYVKNNNDKNLSTILKCFDQNIRIPQYGIYELFGQLVERDYAIDNTVYKKRSTYHQMVLSFIQLFITCNDVACIIIAYCENGYCYNPHLTSLLREHWHKNQDCTIFFKNHQPVGSDRLIFSIPAQSLFNEYYLKQKNSSEFLYKIESGYYELLRINGYNNENEYKNIFKSHYKIFLNLFEKSHNKI